MEVPRTAGSPGHLVSRTIALAQGGLSSPEPAAAVLHSSQVTTLSKVTLGSSACFGAADMRYRRAWYRLLAVAMLAAGLVLMARGAPEPLIVAQLLLTIICAVASLRVRDYS